jgi:hypothetical protein
VASPQVVTPGSNRLDVSGALAAKPDNLQFGLLPLFLHFEVLHNHCELLLLFDTALRKSRATPWPDCGGQIRLAIPDAPIA